MGVSIDEIWAKAQRLTPGERLTLSRRLIDSITEDEADRRVRVENEINRFFGGWCVDERSTEDIISQILSVDS